MNLDEMKNDIIGCLDYDLRHSNHFSGVSGDCDCATFSYTSDDGATCNIKIKIELEDIDLSDYNPYIAEEELDWEALEKYIELAELYMQGSKSILPADDPVYLRKGFVVDDDKTLRFKNLDTYCLSVRLSHLIKYKPDILNKLDRYYSSC